LVFEWHFNADPKCQTKNEKKKKRFGRIACGSDARTEKEWLSSPAPTEGPGRKKYWKKFPRAINLQHETEQ